MTDFSAEAISSHLKNDHFPGKILVKQITASTNDDAREFAGFDEWAVIIAEEQTNGRGRQGRTFYSPKNTGLYLSMVVPVSPENIFRITPAAAVAVCRTIDQIAPGTDPKIKWVNDILIAGKKVAGILCETVPGTSDVIAGVGINLTTEAFPDDIESIAGSVFPKTADKNVIAATLIRELKTAFTKFDFLDEYRKRSAVIGKQIRYCENNQWHDAECIGIEETGGLVIREKNETRTLISGEISIRI